MKNIIHSIQDRKSASFFDEWIFGSYYDSSVLSHLGGRYSGGAEANAEAPRRVINWYF